MSDDNDELGSNLGPAPTATTDKPQLDHDGDGKAGGSKKKAAKGMPKMTWIVLEENDDIPPTGLPVSHNGNAFIIVAGEPVQVPECVLNVLDTAVTSAPQIDPTTRQVLGYRERMRFPYRRVEAPTDAE